MSKDDKLIDSKKGSDGDWKRRTSDISGYQRAFYMTDSKGDYIRIDYNLKEKKVRLYAEIAKDANRPYFSVIQKGKISTEKNVLTGRPNGVAPVFESKARIFSTLPNDELLRVINGTYGISQPSKKQIISERMQKLEETRQRYFVEHREESESGDRFPMESLFGVIKKNFFSILLGAAITIGAYYLFNLSYASAGIAVASYGIFLGIADMFLREKETDMFMVLCFLLLGLGLFVYGRYLVDF